MARSFGWVIAALPFIERLLTRPGQFSRDRGRDAQHRLAGAGLESLSEEAVREDEARARADFDALLEVAGDGIFVFDRDGRMVRASRWARERFQGHVGGVPETLAEIRARVDPRGPDGEPETLMPAERALRGEVVDREIVFSDGRRLHVRAAPIRDEAGEIRGAVSISRDITDLHRALSERARLDGAVKTARLVAHAVNNQLAFITGYAGLLLEDAEAAGTGPAQAQAEMLRQVLQAADNAAAMVARLQRIARFEETDQGGGPMLDLEAATDASGSPG
jgi:two-component system, sensor histidine kinase PdtaS